MSCGNENWCKTYLKHSNITFSTRSHGHDTIWYPKFDFEDKSYCHFMEK
eukprot:UN27866